MINLINAISAIFSTMEGLLARFEAALENARSEMDAINLARHWGATLTKTEQNMLRRHFAGLYQLGDILDEMASRQFLGEEDEEEEEEDESKSESESPRKRALSESELESD